MDSAVRRQLVVFDFDWSMADNDTDRWVLEVLALDLRRKMETIKSQRCWTDVVAECLEDLHAKGKTRKEIEDTLRSIPFHPAMVRAVRKLQQASSPQTMFVCISNANHVYISTILERHGLQDLFEDIITNPARFEKSGLLRLERRIPPDGPQHRCKVGCEPNMCKGQELDDFLVQRQPEFDRIIYIGDGTNDFCPVLRMRSQDMVLCRSGRGLERLIRERGGHKCGVRYWEGAWEVEEIFDDIVRTAQAADKAEE